MLFTASSRAASTRKKPSHAAVSSILPSLGAEAFMFAFWHSARRRSAASSSWSMPSGFSQTKSVSLPMLSRTGMSSSATTWPLRKRASFVTPGMICVMSWQST